ncbi:MAG: polysaccharide biosynthesis C-terminal domain-containing protein, partial [Bacteroidales bacterium]|nr:polysaccharide biosynthesis C-terminal domain-containing protein [Bacteroidales bacterium]
LGIAGVFNQSADKILFPYLFEDKIFANSQLGIYGACFKIAVVMVMFIQAFRYAYEPFIFARERETDNRKACVEAMKYFIILSLVLFLGVMFYIDLLKFYVKPEYYSGLSVVPVVMLGELFYGIYFNLSIWYKLTDKTRFGAYLALFGAAITLILNWILIPIMGYMGSAYATICCYGAMMIASFFLGQKHYPVPYNMKKIGFYLGLAVVFYAISYLLNIQILSLRLVINSTLLIGYLILIFLVDKKYLMAQIKG